MRAALTGLLVTSLLCLSAGAQEPTAPPSPASQPGVQPGSATPTAAAPQAGTPNAQASGTSSPQTPANTIRSSARLVVLDAVVIDKDGNAVTDLRRDEFHITENKDPQQIRLFEQAGRFLPPPDAHINSTADLDRVAREAPVNIIVLDEANTLFEDMAFARYSLRKWLEKQPGQLTTPTMLCAVNYTQFTVVQDYTQDKDAILAALEHHFVAYPWRVGSVSWAGENYDVSFRTLMRVSEAAVGHPGHKNMIWIGRGFPTIAHLNVDANQRLHNVMQDTVNELRDARVTLYTIDPAGVMMNPGKYGAEAGLYAQFGGDPDFQSLASSTGGRNFSGRNDVESEIRTSIRDGASFYTLTYRPTNHDNSTENFRRIEVTVDRPGLSVVTRKGYFLQTAPARVNASGLMTAKLAQQLNSAETSNMAYDAVPFSLHSTAADPNTFDIRVDSRGLSWFRPRDATQPRYTKIILVVTTFDKKGKELKQDPHQWRANAPDNAPATGPLNLMLDFPYKLQPDPKAVRARFVLRVEATGHIGTADVTVGQAANLSSSGQPAEVAGVNPAK